MSETNHDSQESGYNVAFAHTTETGGHEGVVALTNCQSTGQDLFIEEMKMRNDELSTFFSRSQI